MESLKDEPYLYFFIARKEEQLLCEEFIKQIQETLAIPKLQAKAYSLTRKLDGYRIEYTGFSLRDM